MKHPYGDKYAVKVSKAKAKSFCGIFPLPSIGSETLVALTRAGKLYVQNVSGVYFLASPFVPVEHWKTEFGVTA